MQLDGLDHDDRPAAHNAEIALSLRDYCHYPHAQGFAVMLTGPWGSGKTHFIKAQLDELLPRQKDRKKQKPLYVSLYGLKDPTEIGDQLFTQLYPVLGHKASRLAGAVIGAAARATVKVDLGHAAEVSGVLPTLDLSTILKKAEGRIVIFDDFERAVMSPTTLLSAINPLVEHDGCKVIIVTDESKFSDDDEYRSRKEKTVGRTFELKADSGEAFGAFMELIDSPDARDFLTISREIIMKIFADSGCNNLRILKQFLWDFERLWKILSKEQRLNKDAMNELVSLLCASAIELRSGRLTEDIFRVDNIQYHLRLHGRSSSDRPDKESMTLEQLFKRYPSVRFDSSLLDRETISNLILKSQLPIRHIQKQLKRSPYFAKPEEMPSWQRLWLNSEFPVATHDGILACFEDDFDQRQWHDEAVIYHVIGLSLWLSDLGFSKWNAESVVKKVENYIRDIYAGTANFDEMQISRPARDQESAFGLGYMHMHDQRFGDLRDFHEKQRMAWQARGYPSVSTNLRKLMAENSEAFMRDVCFTSGGSPRFARLGVLRYILPEDFASTVVNLNYRDQKTVLMALSIRYDQVAAELELEQEVPWLKDVKRELHSQANALAPIARNNLLRIASEYVDKTVNGVDLRLKGRNSTQTHSPS